MHPLSWPPNHSHSYDPQYPPTLSDHWYYLWPSTNMIPQSSQTLDPLTPHQLCIIQTQCLPTYGILPTPTPRYSITPQALHLQLQPPTGEALTLCHTIGLCHIYCTQDITKSHPWQFLSWQGIEQHLSGNPFQPDSKTSLSVKTFCHQNHS